MTISNERFMHRCDKGVRLDVFAYVDSGPVGWPVC